MKRLLLLSLCCLSGASFAQNAPLIGAGADSSSYLRNETKAGANNEGNALTNNFNSDGRVSGTLRYEQVAPIALGGASSGFGDNCANVTSGAGGSFWFNIGLGRIKESEPCNGRRDASVFEALRTTAPSKEEAAIDRSLANFAACTGRPKMQRACAEMGLIKMVPAKKGWRYDDPVPGAAPLTYKID